MRQRMTATRDTSMSCRRLAPVSTAEGLPEGRDLANGYFCEPTVAEAPLDHRLWSHEMFVPIVMIARVPDKETGLRLANDTNLGLTAGFYGNEEETDWFLDNIEAGVVYTNRPQGATTGAWPGYQRFGRLEGVRQYRQRLCLAVLSVSLPERTVADYCELAAGDRSQRCKMAPQVCVGASRPGTGHFRFALKDGSRSSTRRWDTRGSVTLTS